MMGVWAVFRKQLGDTRWMLGITATALVLLCWLFVFVAGRIERNAKSRGEEFGRAQIAMATRALGGPNADGSSTSLEIMMWKHPLVVLILALWPIARGSAAVAGEIEKGSMDLVLSRPITRSGYLSAQVLAAVFGMAVLAAAMVVGVLIGNRLNVVESPPSLLAIVRPTLPVVALQFALFGYTLALSSIDLVRWRPNLVASVLTLAMYIGPVVLSMPLAAMEPYRWLEKYSLFYYYDPVGAALAVGTTNRYAGLMGLVGLAGLIVAYLAFSRRDLPTNS